MGITLADVHLNYLSWLKGGLVILRDWTFFLSPFLYVTRMYMATVSFIAQLDCLEFSAY